MNFNSLLVAICVGYLIGGTVALLSKGDNPYTVIDGTEEKPSKGQAMVVAETTGEPQKGSYTIVYNTAPQFSVYPDDVKLDTGMLLYIYKIEGDSIFTQITDQ